MLGFLYLILILGWMLIVIFLKCKKSMSPPPHLTLTTTTNNNNYTDNLDRNSAIHIIQLQPDDYHTNTINYQNNNHHQHIYDNSYPIDAVINPAYTNDDELMINAPPPSYDEVMRQPDVYPKVQELIKSNRNL